VLVGLVERFVCVPVTAQKKSGRFLI
jgi:hypothetical protein